MSAHSCLNLGHAHLVPAYPELAVRFAELLKLRSLAPTT